MNVKNVKNFLTLENIFKILDKGIKNDFIFLISFKNNIILSNILKIKIFWLYLAASYPIAKKLKL